MIFLYREYYTNSGKGLGWQAHVAFFFSINRTYAKIGKSLDEDR